jgi:thiol-disulfide isomerase/thioredoxin
MNICRILNTTVVAAAMIIWFEIAGVAHAADEPTLSAPLRSLLSAQTWLNSQPLRPADLRGKVVLVNFWTFSCINCLRMLPHVEAWAAKYKERGLLVVGVQTPEFAFEKDIGNVSKALVDLGVSYPVAIDNDFRVWRAFDNEAWPALYFIGADGGIRHRTLGEGDYAGSERLIEQLLSDADGTHVANQFSPVEGRGPEAAADEPDLDSPETYLGYAQFKNFASPGYVSENSRKLYRNLQTLPLNHWTLAGVWTIGSEFAALNQAPGSITYRFHARDLHLVLVNPSPGHPIRFRVKIDGAPPGANHGSDVDADGWGRVEEDRLYQLVRQTGPIRDRTFEIEFLEPGVRAYTFTFG